MKGHTLIRVSISEENLKSYFEGNNLETDVKVFSGNVLSHDESEQLKNHLARATMLAMKGFLNSLQDRTVM